MNQLNFIGISLLNEEGGSHARAHTLTQKNTKRNDKTKVDGAICQLVSKLNDTMPMTARARL